MAAKVISPLHGSQINLKIRMLPMAAICQRRGGNISKKVWRWATEFVYPNNVNRFGIQDRNRAALATKAGFIVLFALAITLFTLWGSTVPKALCSTNYSFTPDEIWSRRFVSANGVVSEFKLERSSLAREMARYIGYDVSTLFPPYTMLMQNAPDSQSAYQGTLNQCISNMSIANAWVNAWIEGNPTYKSENGELVYCPLPQDPKTSTAYCLYNDWKGFVNNRVGWVQQNANDIKSSHATSTTGWVIIDDSVYDVSQYLNFSTQPIVNNGTVTAQRELSNSTAFLPDWLTQMLLDSVGKDISREFDGLPDDKKACRGTLDALFYHGTTQKTRTAFACANTNIVAWLTFGLYFFIVFVRIFSAECYIWLRSKKTRRLIKQAEGSSLPLSSNKEGTEPTESGSNHPPSPLCAVFVPCFNEDYDDLSNTLMSIVCSAYPDASTLLIIVSDGVPETLRHLLQITANNGLGSDPKMHGCYGNFSVESSSYGFARVYSGIYEYSCNRVPYIIIAKEVFQGRIDSLMMLLNFLRLFGPADSTSVTQTSDSNLPISDPSSRHLFLDEELESQMIDLGLPPASIEYCLLIEPTIQVERHAIRNFVLRMTKSPRLVAISGTLLALNPRRSILRSIPELLGYT